MIYCFDLDGTLCTSTGGKYENAQPFEERIRVVNKFYENGHEIIIESARGSKTGIDWYDFTFKQLNEWGVKFHKLRTGVKVEADCYIDDRGWKDNDFFGEQDL